MDETLKLRALLNDHTMGFVRIQVYKPETDMKWAFINDRSMNTTRGNDMVVSFKAHGIEATFVERAIRIALKPSWIEGEMIDSTEGLRILEVPILSLTAEGVEARKAGLFQPLEGMGRRGGVQGYCAELDKEIRMLNAKIDRLKGEKSSTARLAAISQRDELQDHLDESSWWTFRVLNRGK